MKRFLPLVAILFVWGCGANLAPSINDVQVGMPLHEVAQKANLHKLTEIQEHTLYRGELNWEPYLLKFDNKDILVELTQDVQEQELRVLWTEMAIVP